MPAPQCPDDEALAAWAAGASSVDEARALSAHVEGCDACRQAYAAVVRSLRLETTPGAGGRGNSTPLWAPVQPGEVLLGKYEVERIIGAGGMGVVVAARHLQLNERVALKFVRLDLAQDSGVLARFSREARAAVRLKTTHVCRVHDLGVLPSGVSFMVMEYLEGESLEARLARDGTVSPELATAWVLQIVEALGEAHGQGIVHRDLKPANLFLQRRPDGSETLKILDFGIAKSIHPEIEAGLQATSARVLIGSPAYMAPEQLVPGGAIDPRTDIWALGCTLHAMLTGAPPFTGGDFYTLAHHIRSRAVSVSGLPPALAAIIARCLAKDPAGRFNSVGEISVALAEPPRSRAGHQRLLGAAIAAGLLALGVAGWAARPRPEPVGVVSGPAPRVAMEIVPRPTPLAASAAPEVKAAAPAPVAAPAKKAQRLTAPRPGAAQEPPGDSVFGDRL